MSNELSISKPNHGPDISQVEFYQTKEVHDQVPNLRIYCTMYPSYHSLQIRGFVPLGQSYKKELRKRNLVATISLTMDDLKQIAEYYEQYKKGIKKQVIKCERCGEVLKPETAVMLELSNTDGNYYTEIPKDHISQGGFYFGSACAKAQLQETTTQTHTS